MFSAYSFGSTIEKNQFLVARDKTVKARYSNAQDPDRLIISLILEESEK